jgi:hypothetical protein
LVVVFVVVHFALLEVRMSAFIMDAHKNNVAPLAQSVQHVTDQLVKTSNEGDRQRQIISGLVTENHRLKASLKESVIMMQGQVADNDDLYDEIDALEWKIITLETILDSLDVDHDLEYEDVISP